MAIVSASAPPGGARQRRAAPLPVRLAGPIRRGAWAVVVAGGILLGFAGYQLWGTAWHEDRAQRHLEAEFERLREHLAEPDGDRPPPGDPSPTPPAGRLDGEAADLAASPSVVSGSPVARIEARSIGLDKMVVEGVGRAQLRLGPGHYPGSPSPGEGGNVAIAGHRSTHGSPFGDLDLLLPGDEIVLETVTGRLVYRVQGQPGPGGETIGHRIVSPGETAVLADHGDDRLTLTSCHPRYSARERLVVVALLETGSLVRPQADPLPLPDRSATGAGERKEATRSEAVAGPSITLESSGAEELGWRWHEGPRALAWAVLTALTAIGGWWFGRRRNSAIPWLYAMTVAVGPLFIFYVHVDRLLPAL